jgi:hypothetical protein
MYIYTGYYRTDTGGEGDGSHRTQKFTEHRRKGGWGIIIWLGGGGGGLPVENTGIRR